MKLSVITDEISMDLSHALDVAREYGVEGAELRGIWGKNIADLTDSEAREAKKVIDDKGFAVSCIASPVLKCELDPRIKGKAGRMHDASERTVEEQAELLERCVELACLFETDIIRVFSFWKRGELTPDVEERVAETLGQMAEQAARAGKVIALENEHDCYISTGAEAARVLSKVNHSGVKAVWDPGNAFFAGEEPYPAGYEAVRNHIVHVHVKDAERLIDGRQRFVVIGEGQIDYWSQFAALARDGYKGFVSLETHYVPFAGTPEQGSRLCLAALRSLLDRVQRETLEV